MLGRRWSHHYTGRDHGHVGGRGDNNGRGSVRGNTAHRRHAGPGPGPWRLRCGVGDSAIGFAEPQEDGSYNGFDADYCRAVAAAIFGDAEAVEFVGTTSAERFTVLTAGGVDVPFRTTTWTQSRDTELGG